MCFCDIKNIAKQLFLEEKIEQKGRKVKKSYQQMYFDGNWAKPKYNNVT